MWMENVKNSDVLCPPHPNKLQELPSPIPDNITNAIQAVQEIFSDLVSSSKVVCACPILSSAKKEKSALIFITTSQAMLLFFCECIRPTYILSVALVWL